MSSAQPATKRGRRTRAALVAAARAVFERDGFIGARITDMAEEAGVAIGTFYTYFDSKESIFEAVAADIGEDFSYSVGLEDADLKDPESAIVVRVEASIRTFLTVYRDNAGLIAAIEQAATVDDRLREIRRELRNQTVRKAEKAIRSLQGEGLADPSLDAPYAAAALTSMISNFAYSWLVLGEPFDDEPAAANLSRLWVRAVGLDPDLVTADAAPQ